jgi:hypothetical protein
MKRSKLLFPILLLLFVLAACSPQVAPSPAVPVVETPVVSEPLPPTGDSPAAVEAARQALAERLGIPVEQVSVVTYQQVDWSDGCLGLGGPAEACLAAITPGYAVTLAANGEQYAYRTDMEGLAVREETQEPVPAAVDAARQALAERLGVSVEKIAVVDYQQVDWPDGCLGLGGPAELCLAAITPGYAVILEANGEQYTYRTNLEGTAVRADMFDPNSAAADMARHALAERRGITIDQVNLINMVPVEWPDACLGLPAADELCAMVITPGFEITLQVEEQIYVFHTNTDGSSVREAPSGTPPAETMRDILAQRLGLSLSGVEPVGEESVEWSDTCLGVRLPDVMCAEVITPGYRLVYIIDGEEYVIHTNQDLSSFVVASSPIPDAEEAVIVWEERDGGCSTVLVDERAVAYGSCDDDLMPALFANVQRIEELRYLSETFASFEAETEAGVVTFRGEGQQEASEAEQRAVAEWSRQVFLEAREGQSDPDASQVLNWRREGGIAGFCDVLRVDVSGFAYAESCKGEEPMMIGLVFLSGDQLEQLYAWQKDFRPAELEQKDDAAADGMLVKLEFSGNGVEEASEQQLQSMLDLVNDLHTQIKMQ